MSTHRIVSTALAAGFALITTIPVDAKPTAKPKVKTPTVKATTVKPSTVHGPKNTAKVKPTSASTKVRGSGSQAKAVKPAPVTAKGQAKTSGPASKTTIADRPSGSTKKAGGNDKARSIDGTGTAADTTPVTATASLSKAQQLLMKNDNLRAKMAARLPEGVNPLRAASGFKNLGQFVAAVNVSNNLGIDFFALRARMIGPESMSLGQAIQQVKGVDATTARRAAADGTAMADLDLDATADTATLTKTKDKGHN
jgi:hypothetical protein